MKENILEILRGLVATPSVSATAGENSAALFLEGRLRALPYFKEHPELCGLRPIPEDPVKRNLVYALVRGSGSTTIVLTGHYDVVAVEDFGRIRDYAFDIDALPEKLRTEDITADARRDLESGEWIFGRGVADMKGGLAVYLDYLEEYSRNPGKGNLLFLAVPDEESYSIGMRYGAELLLEMRDAWKLDYALLLDGEPSGREKGKMILSIGTGGKCLPVVVVQGIKAHARNVYDGLNPVGVLGKIFEATELNTDFVDVDGIEASMPPSWTFFKDRKENYDVSLPVMAAGYFNVLSFTTTPEETLQKLRTIAKQALEDYWDKIEQSWAIYKKKTATAEEKSFSRDYRVMSFEELMDYCRKEEGPAFEGRYQSCYDEIARKVEANELNYPQATIALVQKVLENSGITTPTVILSFAPPYYPSMCSTGITGRGDEVRDYFRFITERSKERDRIDTRLEKYSVGLSDLSYAAVDKVFDYQRFSNNTPLWGRLYHISFETIEQLNIPSMLFGPNGKDFHQLGERVEAWDLTERIPALLRELADYVFSYKAAL